VTFLAVSSPEDSGEEVLDRLRAAIRPYCAS
jgi:hypothetical protein